LEDTAGAIHVSACWGRWCGPILTLLDCGCGDGVKVCDADTGGLAKT